jgi:hypothetical protein
MTACGFIPIRASGRRCQDSTAGKIIASANNPTGDVNASLAPASTSQSRMSPWYCRWTDCLSVPTCPRGSATHGQHHKMFFALKTFDSAAHLCRPMINFVI